MVELDIQAISVVVAAIGVSIAAMNNIIESRNASRTRQAQFFMQIYDRFHDKRFWEGIHETSAADRYEEYTEDTGLKMSREAFNKLFAIGAYYEGIGILVKRGLIEVDLVNDLMPHTLMDFYEKCIEPYRRWVQQKVGSPYRWKGFQYLYSLVKKTSEQHLKEWDKYLPPSN